MKRKTDEDMLKEELAEYYSRPLIPIGNFVGMIVVGGLCWVGIYQIACWILQ